MPKSLPAIGVVSILSQPEGRELQKPVSCSESLTSFNPLPARRPGATEATGKLEGINVVSILSQPEGRELLRTFERHQRHVHVSILSQPEGRELRSCSVR